MLRAFALAAAQLFSGPILTVLGLCVMLSVACFVVIWFGIDWSLEHFIDDAALGDGWIANASSVLVTLVLAWLLFPIFASMFVGLFLDQVATTVEKRHYPHLPKAKGLPVLQGLLVSLRFVVVLLLANVLLLALLLVPVAYPVGWFLVNGWLIGREYLELVAMRRLAPKAADELRRQRSSECTVTGMAIAFLMTIPIVNLVIPVLATAMMVHRFHDWQGSARGS